MFPVHLPCCEFQTRMSRTVFMIRRRVALSLVEILGFDFNLVGFALRVFIPPTEQLKIQVSRQRTLNQNDSTGILERHSERFSSKAPVRT
jgi:hypothetical protein